MLNMIQLKNLDRNQSHGNKKIWQLSQNAAILETEVSCIFPYNVFYAIERLCSTADTALIAISFFLSFSLTYETQETKM